MVITDIPLFVGAHAAPQGGYGITVLLLPLALFPEDAFKPIDRQQYHIARSELQRHANGTDPLILFVAHPATDAVRAVLTWFRHGASVRRPDVSWRGEWPSQVSRAW